MHATLALSGTIIGAGIFGVPAMVGAWGVIPATMAFMVITGVVLAVHLLLTEAVLAYDSDTRLKGLTQKWLGSGAAVVVGALLALSVFGGNLAYLILGGEFFAVLGGMVGISLPLLAWQVVFWVVSAVIVLAGLRWMSRVESFLTWILLTLLLVMIAVFFSRADGGLVTALPRTFTFEPYGVFLYALCGFTVISELELIVKGNRQDMRKSVIRGTLIAAALTYLFGISAWLAGGGALGRDVADLVQILPPFLAILIPLVGFLAVMTSFVTTAFDLGEMFRLDYHFPPWLAGVVGLGVPLALLFLTARDFLSTIGLVGSVFGGALSIFIAFIGHVALVEKNGPARPLTLRWWWQDVTPFVIAAFFFLGAITWLLV
jgi:amino acid permease